MQRVNRQATFAQNMDPKLTSQHNPSLAQTAGRLNRLHARDFSDSAVAARSARALLANEVNAERADRAQRAQQAVPLRSQPLQQEAAGCEQQQLQLDPETLTDREWTCERIGGRVYLNTGVSLYEILTDTDFAHLRQTQLLDKPQRNSRGKKIKQLTLLPYRNVETQEIVTPGDEYLCGSMPAITSAIARIAVDLPWSPPKQAPATTVKKQLAVQRAQFDLKAGAPKQEVLAALNRQLETYNKEDKGDDSSDEDDKVSWDQLRHAVDGHSAGDNIPHSFEDTMTNVFGGDEDESSASCHSDSDLDVEDKVDSFGGAATQSSQHEFESAGASLGDSFDPNQSFRDAQHNASLLADDAFDTDLPSKGIGALGGASSGAFDGYGTMKHAPAGAPVLNINCAEVDNGDSLQPPLPNLIDQNAAADDQYMSAVSDTAHDATSGAAAISTDDYHRLLDDMSALGYEDDEPADQYAHDTSFEPENHYLDEEDQTEYYHEDYDYCDERDENGENFVDDANYSVDMPEEGEVMNGTQEGKKEFFNGQWLPVVEPSNVTIDENGRIAARTDTALTGRTAQEARSVQAKRETEPDNFAKKRTINQIAEQTRTLGDDLKQFGLPPEMMATLAAQGTLSAPSKAKGDNDDFPRDIDDIAHLTRRFEASGQRAVSTDAATDEANDRPSLAAALQASPATTTPLPPSSALVAPQRLQPVHKLLEHQAQAASQLDGVVVSLGDVVQLHRAFTQHLQSMANLSAQVDRMLFDNYRSPPTANVHSAQR